MAWDNPHNIVFRNYKARDKPACLSLFDENCPEYFAPNERLDFEEFLDKNPATYQLCLKNEVIVGVFGVFEKELGQSRLEWILLSGKAQGLGLGSIIMEKSQAFAKEQGATLIHIATSHKAFKFFEKKGATIVSETKDGWGPNMHRIDMVLNLQSS